jgi:hypothetical protein
MMEAERVLLSQKLQVFAVMATAGDNKSLINQLLDAWNKLVALTYGSDLAQTRPLTEKIMLEEYEKIRNLRPEFKIDKKTGLLFIKGLT